MPEWKPYADEAPLTMFFSDRPRMDEEEPEMMRFLVEALK